ncbi:hypothetical protein Cni_G17611 [Canna indica]|uniref:AMP-activated protein kinase glycogen-binding domain-containing protein n=1 Tax=Canna indica TaxID=4628 RepID=A0AAQ3KKV2_9LILI|nr:hypothetical protein Cni_G17611 [Canna indica]
MTSLSLLSSPVLLLSSSISSRRSRLHRSPALLPPPFRSFPLLSSPRRAQELFPLPSFHATIPFLGFADRLQMSTRRAMRDEDAPEMVREKTDLEVQIYEFMEKSGTPNAFPTREDLIAAGGSDLVESIDVHGGRFAFGWDPDNSVVDDDTDSPQSGKVEIRDQDVLEDSKDFQDQFSDDSCKKGAIADCVIDSEDNDSVASSGMCTKKEVESVGSGGGIEGILGRLEKQRNLYLAIYSWDVKNVPEETGEFLLLDEDGMSSLWFQFVTTIHMKKNSLFFTAADIVHIEDNKILNHGFLDKDLKDPEMHKQTQNPAEANNRTNISDFYKNEIRLRLQQLEVDLASILYLLRSRGNFLVFQGQETTTQEMNKFSDALEFQETEIINARDKLRSIRARTAVLEGKMALEIIEAKKLMEEKRRRFDSAQNALSLLRTVCILWPNSASEVLLAGSFDGWSSQRMMEKSSSGIFSLHLKLYPGRYELKFLVDGEWKIDPLRPVVHNGYTNNLLIIT